jgi:hypothetical protein
VDAEREPAVTHVARLSGDCGRRSSGGRPNDLRFASFTLRKVGSSMHNRRSQWNLTKVVQYLDRTYPDLGIECPLFAVHVVIFSSAVLQNTDVDYLSQFTGCTRNLVDAIARNMRNNGLWVDGKYDCSRWLANGVIIDQDRFCDETQAGEGGFLFPSAKETQTADLYPFWCEQDCPSLWESLICGTEPPPATRRGHSM